MSKEKLSQAQKRIIKQITESADGQVKLGKLKRNVYAVLLNRQLVTYNDRYDGLRLTELGKQIKL